MHGRSTEPQDEALMESNLSMPRSRRDPGYAMEEEDEEDVGAHDCCTDDDDQQESQYHHIDELEGMEDWRVDDLDDHLERDLHDDGVYDDADWPAEQEGLPELIFTEGCEEDGVELGPCISLQRCSNGRMSATAAGPSGEVDAVRVMLLGVSDSGRPSVGIDLGYACTQQAQSASHRASADASAHSGDVPRSGGSSSHASPNAPSTTRSSTRSPPIAGLADVSPAGEWSSAASSTSASAPGSSVASERRAASTGSFGDAAGGGGGGLDLSGRGATGDDLRASSSSASAFAFGGGGFGGFGGIGAAAGAAGAAGAASPAPAAPLDASPCPVSSPSPPAFSRNRQSGFGVNGQQRNSPGRASAPSPFVFQPPRTPSKQVRCLLVAQRVSGSFSPFCAALPSIIRCVWLASVPALGC